MSARRKNNVRSLEPQSQSGGFPIKEVDKDPYEHIERLGRGRDGVVDKVRQRGKIYARKVISHSKRGIDATKNEFSILLRLKHRHVLQVVEVYQYRNHLSIIMAQVADTDLSRYLETVDGLDAGPDRDAMRKPMQMWPGCLIQAIDYLHEMKVKHKDLKPANILILKDQVLIADFGISKDLIDAETTASVTGIEMGTRMYWAPEVERENARRGRAVDIFALGCIFLEIATVFIARPKSRAMFRAYRETNGIQSFSSCPGKIIQWIWHLWGHWSDYTQAFDKKKAPHDDFKEHGPAVSDLAFLMLDPNPKTRITSRQLVALISAATEELYFRSSIKKKACDDCRTGIHIDMSNLPFHSVYKDTDALKYPKSPDDALVTILADDWEAAKREWLQEHMWWQSR
jgi:serine/threonine protein kinase